MKLRKLLFVGITFVFTNTAFSFEKTATVDAPSSFLKPTKTTGENKLAHVIKLNVSQLAFKNISLQYELGFHKNMSFALGYSNFLEREIPPQIYSNDKAEGYQFPYMKGFAITPEFRFYPGKKEEKPAPHGFYLSPYIRYSKYTLGADYIERDVNNPSITRTYTMTGSLKGTSFGLMLGSQWIIKKHFSFDWWILGAGAGTGKLVLEAQGLSLNLTEQQQQELEADISTDVDELGRFGRGSLTVETTSNSAKATISGVPMLSLRGMVVCGLNVGYKF